MRALSARPIALGALCAALLAGITGPVATAAGHAPGHNRAVSHDTPLPAAETLLGEVNSLNARGAGLAPVADLLTAAVESDKRALPPAEAKELGEAAKDALEDAAAKAAATKAATQAPAASLLVPATGADLVGDALDAVRKAVDDLLDSIFAQDTAGTADATGLTAPSLDQLLAEVSKLVDALTVSDPTASTLPAPATPSSTSPSTVVLPSLPPVTLPALTPPAPVLLPAS